MAQYQLTAQVREEKGKQAAKQLRVEKKIPGIFYGPDSEPIMLSFSDSDLTKILKSSASDNIIMGLQIESDKGTENKMVILKELQSHPVKDCYLHADFYEISMDKELTMKVPMILVNIPKGVTDGGVLQHIRRELSISCLPTNVVEFIEVDVSGLDIGESLHIKDLLLPEGITSSQDTNLTVAVVNAPSVSEAETTDGEGEEGEGSEETGSDGSSEASA